MIKFLGEDFSSRDEHRQRRVRIATVFPASATIVTLPGIHATQRESYIESLNQDRACQGKPPLSEDEQDAEMMHSVDLILDDQSILIRPAPSEMDLAFAADELLQEILPKRQIKFLFLSDSKVRDALKRRGECWRIFLPPTAPREIRQLIQDARSAIELGSIYYHSPVTGTRWLTYDTLRKLAELSDTDLRAQLLEIGIYHDRFNRNGFREVDFFMAGAGGPDAELQKLAALPPDEMRSAFDEVCRRFANSIPPTYRADDLDDSDWRCHMFSSLVAQRDVLVDDTSMGMDSEFSMRVEWLPGGRIDEGELILDQALEERYGLNEEKQVSPVVRGLILNFVQEFGDLEYINLGSVLPSETQNPRRTGRREVYIAQIKQRRATSEVLQVIRFLKWGVRERLDMGDSLEKAMLEAEEYTEYVLDRLLACRQLGMNLPQRQSSRKVSERYDGSNWRYKGATIWTPYFQRDYIDGLATNKISARRLSDRAYAAAFGRLLGQAAASNMIAGRAELTGEAVFDVGDEILVENAAQMPVQIVEADHVGTFVDWKGPLESRAAEYAGPVVRRLNKVADRGEFAEAYLSGFGERFSRLQEEYAKHRRAFDALFKHRRMDPEGSLAFRWASVLERLCTADGRELIRLIRGQIGL